MQKRNWLFAVAVLCLVIIVTAFYLYQKPRKQLADVMPVYVLSAEALYSAFEQDETKANKLYTDKVIQVKGKIESIEKTDTTFNLLLSSQKEMGGINCRMSNNENDKSLTLKMGSIIEVKGKCVGFLMDVNLVDAIVINQ